MSNLFVLLDISSKGFLDVYLDITSLFSILFGTCVINSKNPIVSVLFLIGLFLSISINLILLGYNFIGLSYLLVYVGAVSILFLFILMLINVRISELLNETANSIPLALFTSFSFGFIVHKILNHIDSIKDKYKKYDLSFWLKNENISENTLNYYTPNSFIRPLAYNSKNISNNHSLINKIYINQENFEINNTSNTILKELAAKRVSIEYKTETMINNDKELYDVYFATSNSWDDNLIEFTDITSIGNILYTSYGIWLIICSIILLLAMIGAINITKKEKD